MCTIFYPSYFLCFSEKGSLANIIDIVIYMHLHAIFSYNLNYSLHSSYSFFNKYTPKCIISLINVHQKKSKFTIKLMKPKEIQTKCLFELNKYICLKI